MVEHIPKQINKPITIYWCAFIEGLVAGGRGQCARIRFSGRRLSMMYLAPE